MFTLTSSPELTVTNDPVLPFSLCLQTKPYLLILTPGQVNDCTPCEIAGVFDSF